MVPSQNRERRLLHSEFQAKTGLQNISLLLSGQTWTMMMIGLILEAKQLEINSEVSLAQIFRKIPFLEMERPIGVTGVQIYQKLKDPRFSKTHLPLEFFQDTSNLDKKSNLKIIQNIRNPKNTLVSYFHHARNTMGRFAGTWNEYFEFVVTKKLP